MSYGTHVLFQELDGTRIEVRLPLTSKASVEEQAKDLGIPAYIEITYSPIRRAIATLWAAQNAHRLHEIYPEVVGSRLFQHPISALLFGGAAIKLHCPSANDPRSPLYRPLRDVDFFVPRKAGWPFYNLLLRLSEIFGTRFLHFRTRSDAMFNAMRHGDRYRIRAVDTLDEGGPPIVSVTDIFCDRIELRHRVEVGLELKRPRESLYTIGLENLILTKCQSIGEIPGEHVERLEGSGQGFRTLPYEYRGDKALIGMEEKDIRDVCAIMLDHPVGGGGDSISPPRIVEALKRDERLALTCRLNIQNIHDRPGLLNGMGLSSEQVSTIRERLGAILNTVPRVGREWHKPWWTVEVEEPRID